MARVFLSNETYNAATSGAQVFGAAGTEQVNVFSGTTGVSVASSVERVDLSGNIADYTFSSFGAAMTIRDSAGNIVATVSDSGGKSVVFADGALSAAYAGTTLSLGGVALTGTAAAITPAAAAIDATTTSDAPASTGGTTGGTGQTFTLTTGVDALTGTAGNDTFIALQENAATETFGVADVIDGGAGTDTISLTSNEGAAVNGATITNVENMIYRPAVASGDIDLANFTSIVNLTVDRLTGATNIDGVALTDTLLLKDFLANANTTVTYGGTLTGTADAATVTLQGAADGAEVDFAGAVETMTVKTSGSASRLDNLVFDAATKTLNIEADEALTVDDTFTAAALTKLTATGDSLVTITPTLATTAVTVDSSAQTAGGLVVTAGNVGDTNGTAADFTFTGGAGKDSVNITAADDNDELSVSTGAGDDTVTIGTDAMDGANDVINGGDGIDTLVVNNEAAITSTTVKSISNFETLSVTDDDDGGAEAFDVSLLAGITAVKVAAISAADGITLNNLNATQAGAVTVSGTQAVDLTLGVKDAAKVGQLDTINLTVDDGLAATNTITFADLSADGVETVNVTANDNVTFTAITGLTGFTKLDVGGAGNLSLTTGALALNTNSTIDASDSTGTVTIDASSGTTNGTAIIGSSTKANEITGTNQNDAITGGTGVDTVTNTNNAATDADTIDFVSDSAADVFVISSVVGKSTITNFDAATTSSAEDLVNVSADTLDGAEVEITAAAAQAALGTDRTIVIEQNVGTAASLTTGGTATLATADFEATTLTNVAAFLAERFTVAGNTETAAVFLNNGTNTYAYAIDASAGVANGTLDAAEVSLIGVFNGAILQNEDIFQTV